MDVRKRSERSLAKANVLGRKLSELDVPTQHDLAMAIRELIQIENHAKYSWERTKNEKWLNILIWARKTRGKFMELLIPDEIRKMKLEEKGELWCCLKHLLDAHKRLEEVGDKLVIDNQELAKQFYEASIQAYDFFWLIVFPEFHKKEERKETG